MDELVYKGIINIQENGTVITIRAGVCQQTYGVSYKLLHSVNRIFNLRNSITIRYFCRELLAFFKGTLNINNGLNQASKFWSEIAEDNGDINSNYGYYVFYEKANQITQFDWVIEQFKKNIYTRKAFISINQNYHKKRAPNDFPCTIGLHFFIWENSFCCDVYMRSEDIIWGLPNDLGFFSILTELLFGFIQPLFNGKLNLGHTMIKSTFTQIYDRTKKYAPEVIENYELKKYNKLYMPKIDKPHTFLKDVYNQTLESDIMKWIYLNSYLT